MLDMISIFLNFQKQMTMKTQHSKPMGCRKSIAKREVYSNTTLPQEKRKTSNRQPKFTPKTTGKKKNNNKKISRRKEIIKIRT